MTDEINQVILKQKKKISFFVLKWNRIKIYWKKLWKQMSSKVIYILQLYGKKYYRLTFFFEIYYFFKQAIYTKSHTAFQRPSTKAFLWEFFGDFGFDIILCFWF